ncbi:hypothetical protein IWW38_004250, partial [Coemansia aciculifera]
SVAAFVRWVRHIVPNASEVSVSLSSWSFHDDEADLGDLISRLYQLVYRIEYHCFDEYDEYTLFRFDVIGNLTHVNVDMCPYYDQFMQLVRHNSQTLESFSVESTEHMNIRNFIQHADGSCVKYPQLLSLKLMDHSDVDEQQRFVFTDAVPFPSLKRLYIYFDLPFDDDTPFRGNASTLEVLVLALNSSTVSMLRRRRTFTPVSHPKLQHVCISIAGDYDRSFPSIMDFMRFVLSVGPRAPVRT